MGVGGDEGLSGNHPGDHPEVGALAEAPQQRRQFVAAPEFLQGEQMSIVGLADPVETYEEAVMAWHHLDGLRDDLNWTYGALVSLVAVKYGEATLEKYAKDVGRSVQAIRQYRAVFEEQNDTRVAFSSLKWIHFRAVQPLLPAERVAMLSLAEKNGWKSRELERHIRQVYPRVKLLPEGKFRVIYADPPWEYPRDQHSKEEQETVLRSHYESLSMDELGGMAVKDIAADDSVLFLWATSPKIEDALDLAGMWGFDYKASIVWDKVKHNVGYYVSVRHEFLLICTKGSCLPDVPELHDSVVSIERTEHSEKPEYFRDLIDKMYPNGPRIELFARTQAKGWTIFGDQVERARDTD